MAIRGWPAESDDDKGRCTSLAQSLAAEADFHERQQQA